MGNKICVIAPYADLAELACAVGRETPIPFDVWEGNLEIGGAKAQQAEKEGAQVIVSRGGTASIIRQKVNVPVVEIQVTGYDVLRVMRPLIGVGKTAGIVGYFNVVKGCRYVCDILGIHSREFILSTDYTEIDWDEIRARLRRIIEEEGVDVLIGDTVAFANCVGNLGREVLLITSGRESILRAVEEAANLLSVREEEQKNAQRFEAVLNFVHDGVLATDEAGLLTVVNPVAEKIFDVQRDEVLGLPVTTVIQDTRIDKVLASGSPEFDQLQQAPAGHILTNRIPIRVDDEVKGVVATFQEVSQIEAAERKIRQNLYGKGMVTRYTFRDILTRDPQMKRLIKLAKGYAKTNATILIQGESGTGKELFAQSIHAYSPRAQGPFVAINCSALPPPLLESELFGYVEGAFTGAKRSGKIGLFEMAHNGTIFLDEIGEMDRTLQARLLRVLEERQVMRLGSDSLIPVNIRVLAATNQDLRRLASQGTFRVDLLYRLNVLNLPMAPLRQRKADIAYLAEYFLSRYQVEHRRRIEAIPPKISELLERYEWPGNVRELKNVMERLVLSAENGRIEADTVRLLLEEMQEIWGGPSGEAELPDLLSGTLQQIKQRVIAKVLQIESGNKSRAAKRLGVDRATIDRLTEE
jgi:transcriptional regulator with PAS, ATPase and Fis domain